MNRSILMTLTALLFACEPPAEPTLEIELVGCIDEPQPWETCADFCEWDGAVCAENACEGITVRSYAFDDQCFVDGPQFTNSSLGCTDTLIFDDAKRFFYNCCCDYR